MQYQKYRQSGLDKQLADERLDAARAYWYGLDTWGDLRAMAVVLKRGARRLVWVGVRVLIAAVVIALAG